MTTRKPRPKAKRSTINREKIGRTPLDPTRPIGDRNPPIETQFKPGAPSPNPKGRPRTLGQLKDLIQELANEITPSGMTRLELMVRSMMLSKNATDKEHVLAYGWGRVPQQTQERTWEDDIIDLLHEGRITEEQIRSELPENAERIITLAKLRRGESVGTESQSASADPETPAEPEIL